MESSLIHTKVVLLVSEPWDLGEFLHWQALPGEIIGIKRNTDHVEALLVRLIEPFTFRGVVCEFLVAQPRFQHHYFEELFECGKVNGGFTRISTDRAKSETPFDLSWWRGGIAFLANVELL